MIRVHHAAVFFVKEYVRILDNPKVVQEKTKTIASSYHYGFA